MAEYEFEQLFKKLITEKGYKNRDNSDLKNRILGQIDSMDAAEGVGRSRPFRWIPVTLAAAASLVLCIAAAFYVSDYYRYQTEIVPFIDAYYAHATNNQPDDTYDYSVNPFDYLNELTGIRVDPKAFPIELIRSVGTDTIKGIPFGTIEMDDPHNPGGIITVFVTTADKYTLPSKPCGQVDGREMFVHTCNRCCMVGETKKDLVLVVLSQPKTNPSELAHLTAGI